MAEHVAHMQMRRNSYSILVGKSEVNLVLGRIRCRFKDNFKMDLIEIGWGIMNWTDLTQNRDHSKALVNTVMNICVP
jgi:hypothetical protein